MRRALLVLFAVAALAVPAVAVADSCANFSRPPAACGFTCTSVVTVGNWVWLPSLSNVGETGLPPLWGFAPPGRFDSTALQLPGENGNYTNAMTSSLLGMSSLCKGQSAAIYKRQDGAFFILISGGDISALHGVWSGCEK